MKKNLLLLFAATLFMSSYSNAQNPIIRDQFTADPSAHVFEGKVYLYPSHDIPAPVDYGRKDWFCMEDYHVFSSENLVDWVDHGMILSQTSVPWTNPTAYSMWAPDCGYKNGKYYFYFPAPAKPVEGRRMGNSIGVAISDTPYGPFKPMDQPIAGASGIDPCIFIDDDGQPYLIWSGFGLQIAKLKDNMVELDSEPVSIKGVPDGMKEGPFLFKRNGKYYFTYPWVEDARETLAYSMSDSPMGPYEFKGKIMEQHENVCWTNHHSFINFKNQWYLFYHHNDYSPYFDKNRSACIDSLSFNNDGTIKLVKPTLRGVGITDAKSKIQIDRYSEIRDKNATIEFVNADRTFDGWKVVFYNTDQDKVAPWVRYNKVDFGTAKLKLATVRTLSPAGGKLEIRVDAVDGPVLATVTVPGTQGWVEQNVNLSDFKSGVHDLYVLMTDGSHVSVDWVSFK